MSKILKYFDDGSFLEYGRGLFDDWCVFYTNSHGEKKPPKDIDYFTDIKRLSTIFGADLIYKDYVSIYDLTINEVEQHVLNKISEISKKYNEERINIDVIFSILYLGMIAEERKANTRLGKRIKRLGMYKLLIEDEDPNIAANFMRGMNWFEISKLCTERGF